MLPSQENLLNFKSHVNCIKIQRLYDILKTKIRGSKKAYFAKQLDKHTNYVSTRDKELRFSVASITMSRMSRILIGQKDKKHIFASHVFPAVSWSEYRHKENLL